MKCNTHGKFLGYYFGLGAFLSRHPNGIPGGCFVNGETLSLWVWDEVGRQWVDSNRADNWLSGMVDNTETFVPETKTGVKTAYLYMAKEAGTITFTHFLNSGKPLSITVDGISVVMLFWNGNYWEHEVALLSAVDMDKYFRTEVDSEESVTKAGDAGDASWLETRWDETIFDGKKEAVSRRQVKLGNSAIGVTSDGRAYVERERECKSMLTTEEALRDFATVSLSNVDEAEFAYKNVLPTSVWECTLDDDPETATPGVRSFIKMNMIELWEAANKQRRLLVKSTGIGTLVSPVSCNYVETPGGDRFVSAQIIFLGADDYVYRVNFNENGSIAYQSYWNHTEFTKKEALADYAKKDLSNVFDYDIRDKAGLYEILEGHCSIDKDHSVIFSNESDAAELVGATAENGETTLYFTSSGSFPDAGYAISPVSAKIVYGRESLSYVAMFVGMDDYMHKVVWDEEGNLTKQYAYSLDDFATKQDLEELEPGDLTSKGYKPTHVIDLGRYENGAFGIGDAWYWGDVQGVIYDYLDGKCNLLLKGASNYNEPRMYTIDSVERNGDTRFAIRFKISATRVFSIHIDEDADTEGGESVVTQSYIDLGSSGSGTITSSNFSDTEYTEITNKH